MRDINIDKADAFIVFKALRYTGRRFPPKEYQRAKELMEMFWKASQKDDSELVTELDMYKRL